MKKLACATNSSIDCLLAVLHEKDEPHPQEVGILVMERMGDSLDKYLKNHAQE